MSENREVLSFAVLLLASMEQQIQRIKHQIINESDPIELLFLREQLLGYVETIHWLRNELLNTNSRAEAHLQ